VTEPHALALALPHTPWIPHALALALPHTPWIPHRVESFRRLGAELHAAGDGHDECRTFSDRESNKVWPRKLWGWALDTGATHLVQLQDDVIVSPHFWATLRAMLTARPRDVIGLSAVHPHGPDIARQGHRWYRTPGVVGWAYVFPRELLAAFVAWVDARPEIVAVRNEDDLIGDWLAATGRTAWHPVPTIVDHDVSVPSTYANDAHMHRRATVTWRGYDPADLVSADWWRGDGPVLATPELGRCWACETRAALVTAPNGVGMCGGCLMAFVGARMGVTVRVEGPAGE
jgi:hypothetical protein